MDSPRSGSHSPHRRNNMQNYSLDDDGDDQLLSNGQQRESSFDRHDQTVFDLSMDYDEDDQVLLDWEQYAGMKRVRCCGLDCTRFVTRTPCSRFLPPSWWYQLTRKQKRLFWWICGGFAAALVIILAIIALPSSSKSAAADAISDNTEDIINKISNATFLNQYSTCRWDAWRLPAAITPVAYNLSLNVQLHEPFKVTGTVQIQLNVTEDTPCVVLHTSRMNISSLSVMGNTTGGVYAHNTTSEQMILGFDSLVPRPLATIGVDFDYYLRPGLEGLYRSEFTAADGVNNTLGTTQFETSGARLAFPCLDEPALKATFDISLTTETGLTALSNMPVASTQDLSGGLTSTQFAASPPMSTYLVALIMGNLTSVSTMVPHPVSGQPDRNVSIYGTPDRAGNLQTALDITARVLPAFESLFDIPFSLPKLDLIGIPDFAAGAMENWGLITYRETALLVDPDHASLADVRNVAYIIAHEMTHQWFGDLVTCDYWGELWLNEGFATYFENYGATAARPEYRFFDTFYAAQTSLGQLLDAKNVSTHALATTSGVDSIGRIESFFDAISYQKGGSVIRMFRAYLNSRRIADEPYGLRRSLLQAEQPDVFIRGLQRYLKANQYSTGSSEKLWEAVGQETHLPIPRWTQQWTYQSGFPLVNAERFDTQVVVSQVPFTSQGPGVCDETNTTGTPPWWIPLPTIANTNPELNWAIQLDTCVGAHAATITVDPGTEWVKLNAGQYGFYRVNYTQPMWESLAAAAAVSYGARTVLGSEDLAGLLDDAYQLSKAGVLSITVYLDLIRSLAQRPEPLVSAWMVGASPLTQIYKYLNMAQGEASCAAEWSAFVRNNISIPVLTYITAAQTHGISISSAIPGTDANSESLRLLRPTLLSLAGYFNTTTVAQPAVQLLQDNANNVLGIDPDVRELVYTQAVANGGAASYDIMRQLYLDAIDPSEKERNMYALAYARNTTLRQRTLEMVLEPSVRSQDALSLLSRVAVRSNTAAHAAWDFFTENWMALYRKLGGDNEASRIMGKATQSIASHFAIQSQIDEVNQLYEAHKQYLSERSYFDNGIDSIQANMQWLQSNAEQVCQWLQSAS